jgi:hypothetical protein
MSIVAAERLTAAPPVNAPTREPDRPVAKTAAQLTDTPRWASGPTVQRQAVHAEASPNGEGVTSVAEQGITTTQTPGARPGASETGDGSGAVAPDVPTGKTDVPTTAKTGAAPGTPAAPKVEAAKPPSPREAMAPAIGAIKQRAAGARKHTPAVAAVASAQAAAKQPDTEQKRSAATATVDNLDAAKDQSKQVARETFKGALKDAIEKATPKPTTEDQANEVVEGGAKKASATVQGQLATQTDAAVGPLKNPAAAEVPPGQQPAPPETSLKPEEVGPRPAPVSAAPVVPPPLPAQRLDYSADRGPTDDAMAQSGVTKAQLEKGNEPEFGKTLQARSTAEQHEAQAEAKYRKAEANVQNNAEGQAHAVLAEGLGGMHNARATAVGKVAGQQAGTKTKDQAERQRITETIDGIKKQTLADVENILKEMETDASKIFGEGLTAAEAAYRDTFEEEKGGVGTWLTTWGDDWRELIENSLSKARREYLHQVDLAIDKVADCVDAKLEAAKKRVAEGRTQVQKFVNGLDTNVKQYGEEALANVSADFDAMASMIDERRDALVDTLTAQFKKSYERMSTMEEELRSANKSLWDRVYDATVGLVKKIIAFKDMLVSILSKAADVVTDIIADPIGFLGNLVSGVMLGLKNFMGNIGTHLKKGLLEWLFGALGGAGLVMPDTLDLKGIISIVLQVLGLTYANFRARAVKIVGEPVVSALEQAAEVFKVIVTEGIPGLWRFIKEKLEDLKSMVLDAIFDYIKEKVIIAGITWVIGLLNPASAFVKACKAIYDIVMFFINHGSQIIELVNAVIDSMAAIAKGSIGVAATFVENALAKAIPVAIGFLASLLDLGDISETIRKTIDKAQAPVNKAIDWVINQAVKVVKAAGKLVGGLLGGKQDTPDPGKSPDAPESELSDVIDEGVPMAGMTHHLKNDGPNGTLVLHSSPVLVNTIADSALQALVTAFNAASTKKDKHAAAIRVALWIAAHMPATGPGGSAPNIGKIERHGSQPPRLENAGVPLWSLRSEHVVPFVVVRGLWEALGVEGEAKRKHLSTEDTSLTTIMIYKGAGDAKDAGEGTRRTSATARIRALTAVYVRRPDADTPAADAQFRQQIMALLRDEQAWFQNFTWQKVQEEHAAVVGTTTHGALRAETSPVPSSAQISKAANLELSDSERILDHALRELERP